MGVLDISITGLRVAQAGLLTTSHNIANASTTGYNRQTIAQTTAQPNFAGYGFVGQGSNVASVRRVYNEYLGTQILGAEANVGELDMYLLQAQQIDNLLADPQAGLSPALSDFFQATQQVAADPGSVPARQSMISSAEAMVARFKALDQRLTEIGQGVNTQLINTVSTINAYAVQIAELNDRIIQATSIAQGQPPNDLLDQRDQLIRQINKEVQVTVVPETNGGYNVFIGTGQPLVVGTQTYKFVADSASGEDPERIAVNMVAPNGARVDMPEFLLKGGQLGGLLGFRSETLDFTQSALGKIALALGTTFNAQHRMGIDLQGVAGLDFFSIPQPGVLANSKNTGTATLSAAVYDYDYKVEVSGGAATVTRLPDGAAPVTVPLSDGSGRTSYDGILFPDFSTVGDGTYIVKPGNPPDQRVVAESGSLTSTTFEVEGSHVQTLQTIASDYRLSVMSGGRLQLMRLSDSRTWAANSFTDLQERLATDPQGFMLAVDNEANWIAGDSFLIQPTRNVVKSMAVSIVDPLKMAAAAPFRTSAELTNEGTGKIDAGSVVALDATWSPLPGGASVTPNRVTITYSQATGEMILDDGVNPSLAVAFTSGQPNKIVFRGMQFTLSGVPADGDRFILEANKNGVSDNRNAIAMGNLQMAAVLNDGAASYQSAYGQIVSFVGNKTREVEVTGQAQQTLADQAENMRQQVSGVNLDEEAANLLKYQQAYQASAKIMQTSSELFQLLLDIG